jgi:diaminohydroxyphosphoribosylaminopyrimidine deaminase/5-amino-6-(5-phosphoribosylamino)uracil reductase
MSVPQSKLAPHSADARCDEAFMAAALALGRRGLGATAPNPSVGALVVRQGVIVGRGATRAGGRPHAETEALLDAGARARGATLYVSLEPCSHQGVTPPCATAIIAAGVARVVSALDDPDPRVAGRGHRMLREAGVAVTTGVLAEAARRANLGHILRVTEGRPTVTLKLAETADGFAAGSEHDPRLMITGPAANNVVQTMRAMHDAIMIGSGTARRDDPRLDVRLNGLTDREPLRIVLDTNLTLPLGARLVTTARQQPTLVIAGDAAPAAREQALAEAGVAVLRVMADSAGHVDLGRALGALATRGITRILSEGGPTVAARLIAEGFADTIHLFTSRTPLGRAGVAAIDGSARARLADPGLYRLVEDGTLGIDRLRRYERVL